MSPAEIKEYCTALKSFKAKAKVRLKSEANQLVGRVMEIDTNHFVLQTEADNEAVSMRYVSIANITTA